MLNIDFPFHIDSRGRTATTSEVDHCVDLLIQLLLTMRGERVNRPDFGSPLPGFVFEPNGAQTETGLQGVIQAAGIQWLADRIDLEDVQVAAQEATRRVKVKYRCKRSGQQKTREFPLDLPEP